MLRPPLAFAVLAVAILATFWRVGQYDFISHDDPVTVTREPMVNQGLRGAAVLWAFTGAQNGNWQPLTALTHMLDCSLFDLDAAAHHWVNLSWHLFNSMLVFVVWRRLSGAAWASGLVAGFFALHPCHVESVAWISQRKDLVSTGCWLMTLGAYAHYVRRPTFGRFGWVVLGTALSLMSKPMTVTLPFTLLLLDYWPLRRWPDRTWGSLCLEKAPLFILATVASITTVIYQRGSGMLDFGETLSRGARIGNALVSYSRYLWKLLWPANLSPYYPHPGAWSWWAMAGSLLVLLAGCTLAWRERERRRWLAFGWLWYLGTLVPAIGLVQSGGHSMADRYTYVPFLGLFTAIAWTCAEAITRWPALRVPLGCAAGSALVACAAMSAKQVSAWKDGLTLCQHTQATVGEDEVVLRMSGAAYAVAGRPAEELITFYQQSLEKYPEYPYFLSQLGEILARAGRFDEAWPYLNRVCALRPADARSFNNLGGICIMAGRLDEAERHLRQAETLDPRLATANRFLGQLYAKTGRPDMARDAFMAAMRKDRWDWNAANELGTLEYQRDHFSEALRWFERAHWINPSDKTVADNVRILQGKMDRARSGW